MSNLANAVATNSRRTSKPRLLIIDDNPEICDFLREVGTDLHLEVVDATSAPEALTIVDSFKPNIIILDLCMPDMDGVEMISVLAEKRCDSAIILISGMDQRTLSSVQALGRDKQLNMLGTLSKPMNIASIESLLSPFVDQHESVAQAAEAKTQPADAPHTGFGLSVGYEPELMPHTEKESGVIALRATPQVALDDGRCITESAAYKLTRTQGLSALLFRSFYSEVVNDLARWSSSNFAPMAVIGLPAFLLENSDLPGLLESLAAERSLTTSSLVLELFETDSAALSANAQAVLSRLRLKGFKIHTLVSDSGDTALSSIDYLPIDQFVVDLGKVASLKGEKPDIETEFLYSSLNSVANRKGVEVCAINVNARQSFDLALQCRFNSLRGTQVHLSLDAKGTLAAHREGRFSQHQIDLIQPV